MLRIETARCGSGDDEPAVIRFGARHVQVLAIIDRRYAPERRCWKARTAEGDYILRLDHSAGAWDLAAIVGE